MISFKKYFFEGLIKVPTNEIRAWVERNYDEFINKLNETLKNGYDTNIDENIKVKNPYNNEVSDIAIEIRKNLLDINKNPLYFLYDPQNQTFFINASNFIKYKKENYKEMLLSGIIHEFTHSIDPGFKHTTTDKTSYETYINSQKEFQAYANEYIDRIKNNPNKTKMLNNIVHGKNIGIKDIDDFYSDLNPDNKKKFIKLLYKEIHGQSGNSDKTEL
jgi:deoxycytidine triphosphate deaminase